MVKHLLARITRLEQENNDLRATISDLKQEFGLDDSVPPVLGLNRAERKMLGVLFARRIATKGQCMTGIMVGRGGDEEPDMRVLDVYIHRMRVKLKPFGIVIVTEWGTGWYIDEENKQKIAALLNPAAPAVQPVAELLPA